MGGQTVITLHAYEWDTLIGLIFISIDTIVKSSANYKIKFDKVWKVEAAAVTVEKLEALLASQVKNRYLYLDFSSLIAAIVRLPNFFR